VEKKREYNNNKNKETKKLLVGAHNTSRVHRLSPINEMSKTKRPTFLVVTHLLFFFYIYTKHKKK